MTFGAINWVKYFTVLKVLFNVPFSDLSCWVGLPRERPNNHFVWTVSLATLQHSRHIEFAIFAARTLADVVLPRASKRGSLCRRQSTPPVWFQVNISVKITDFFLFSELRVFLTIFLCSKPHKLLKSWENTLARAWIASRKSTDR